MKLGYRERVALLVVIVLAILALGIFAFMRPQWKKLAENQKKLEQAESDWTAKLGSFQTINPMRENITKRRDEAYNVSQNFTDEMTSLELDRFMQDTFLNIDKFKEDKVEGAEEVMISDETTTTLGYYYYTPSIATYPLYTTADFDGTLQKAAAEKLKEATALGSRSAETVGCGNVAVTLKITREDTYAFIDAVREYAKKNNDAMLIQSVEIKEPDFNGEVEKEGAAAPSVDAEGNPIPQDNKKEDSKVTPGYTNVTFKYQVFYMQEPMEVKEKIGPAYDETIWEGKEWKSYTSSRTPAETAAQ